MELTKIILPLLMVIALYLLFRYINIKEIIVKEAFIKARIILGCIGVGYFLFLAIQTGDLQSIIVTLLLSALVIYGVISLQNKYLTLKK